MDQDTEKTRWPTIKYLVSAEVDEQISELADSCNRLPTNFLATAIENYLHIYSTLETEEDRKIWIDEKAGVSAEELEAWRQERKKNNG